MKQMKWISGVLCLVFLLAVAGFFLVNQNPNHTSEIRIGRNRLQVEVVSKPRAIEKGLSDRDTIGSDGMLFLFVPAQEVKFWMKDMRFDLDLIWIYQGKIVKITSEVPKPVEGLSDTELPLYESPGRVDMVLEVPAGMSQTKGFLVGDQVSLPVDNP